MSNKNKGQETGSTETAEAPKKRRAIMITCPYTNQEVGRADWMRAQLHDVNGPHYGDRASIAKKLSETLGREIPYQWVNAATNDDESKALVAQRRERIKDEKAKAKADKAAAKTSKADSAGDGAAAS